MHECVDEKRANRSENGEPGERQSTGENKRQVENQLKESHNAHADQQQAGKQVQVKQKS